LKAFVLASALCFDKPSFLASTVPFLASNQAANFASACSCVKAPYEYLHQGGVSIKHL
jgi:hypothetical protein